MSLASRVFCALLASAALSGVCAEKRKVQVGDEEWVCDENGQCDEAPEITQTAAIFQGSIMERQLRLDDYEPHCGKQPNDCYHDVIARDLEAWVDGITTENFEKAFEKDPDAVRYQIIGEELYRVVGLNGEKKECKHPARCQGIEYALLQMIDMYVLPGDIEFAVNIDDYPVSRTSDPVPIFSYSKNSHYNDILFPHWSFYKGGPCVEPGKKCIGKWDKSRKQMMSKAAAHPWASKKDIAFFRGSRTSDDREEIMKFAKKNPGMIDAKYTKGLGWKDNKDSGGQTPAELVPLSDHCEYKYLFNMRGEAASVRMRHLFLCNSLVFHVDASEWQEFWYYGLRRYVHYIPIKRDFSDAADNINWAKEHPTLAEKTARYGYEFVRDNLRMEDIYNYWYDLLRNYHKVMNWEVKKHPNAVRLKLKGAAPKDEL